jgi:general secretion pathway protein H
VHFDRRVLVGDSGDTVVIPPDVEPNGSSTGAVLKLSHQQAEYEVRVNWYTGGVDIFAEQAQ